MIKVVEDGGFVEIHCITCIIYLVARDALGMGDIGASHSAIRQLIELGKWITDHFSHVKGSKTLWGKKQAYVGFPQHCLIQDVSRG